MSRTFLFGIAMSSAFLFAGCSGNDVDNTQTHDHRLEETIDSSRVAQPIEQGIDTPKTVAR